MKPVRSQDGTPIAYHRAGEGPPVILVDGAYAIEREIDDLAAALKPQANAPVWVEFFEP